MHITKKQWRLVGVVVAVLALAGVYYAKIHESALPSLSPSVLELNSATTSTATPSTVTSANTSVSKLVINPADAITSWNFKGAYTGNETLTAQANADITRLTELLGKGEYDDYDLYIGIANDCGLLGEGTLAYQYYTRAIAVHPNKGLAYVNLAHLFDQLGASHSAADAYARATTVEAGMLEYHIERLTFLTRTFPNDATRIAAALTAVSKQFGDNASILAIEAQWLTGQKRYVDAIGAWEKAKLISPGKDVSSIDAAIAELKAKQ